jgi:predicted ester cyclase
VRNELACGSATVLELTYEGTHTGPLQLQGRTIPATNRRIAYKGAALFQVSNGKVVSWHQYHDNATVMAQLGFGAGAPATIRS